VPLRAAKAEDEAQGWTTQILTNLIVPYLVMMILIILIDSLLVDNGNNFIKLLSLEIMEIGGHRHGGEVRGAAGDGAAVLQGHGPEVQGLRWGRQIFREW